MDLIQVPLTEKQLERRTVLIDEVMKEAPGPKRWRAAVNMMLKLNPVDPDTGIPLSEINKQCIKDNRIAREGLLNKFGTSGTSDENLRSFLSMPKAMKHALQATEPLVFKDKKNASLMFKEFPEYRACEVY